MKVKIPKTRIPFKKIPKILARRPFLTFWVFLILALAFGGLVFYKYYILVEKPEIETTEPLKFKKGIYERALNQLDQREKNLENIESKQYINPFQEKRVEISAPTSSEEEFLPEPEEELPEEPELPSNVKQLLAARSLFEFYAIKGEKLPSIWQRERMWEEKGLSYAGEYKGTKDQNLLLLDKLKEELTQ